MCSSTLSLTSALDGMGSQRHTLLPRKKTGTHFTGGWVGPRPVWMGAEILALPTGFRFPDRPARSSRNTDSAVPVHLQRR